MLAVIQWTSTDEQKECLKAADVSVLHDCQDIILTHLESPQQCSEQPVLPPPLVIDMSRLLLLTLQLRYPNCAP
jgi:hypothetical protein